MTTWGYIIVVGGSTAAVLGLLVGLSAAKFRSAPTIYSWAVVAAWLLLVAASIGWTVNCPRCESLQSYDSARALDIYMAVFWGLLVGAPVIAITWLGVLVSLVIFRRRPERA
jgi:hypothetical protein